VQKISPCLWFDAQCEQAMQQYTAAFRHSQINTIQRYPEGFDEGPMAGMGGKVLTATFELDGSTFLALDGGPQFRFTPAISFFVNCETEAEVDHLWTSLSEGGTALMELGAYPFSPKFGWLQDRFGVTWQINLAPRSQKIVPLLTYVGEQAGRAEEAMNMYISVFGDGSVDSVDRYEEGDGDTPGLIKHAVFRLFGQDFMAMESTFDHQWTFNEAVSLVVECNTQEEVDRYWHALSAVPEAEQCGWLKDRFGVSWQIIPKALGDLMTSASEEQGARVMGALLQMKKIDIATLEAAYRG
jgi:predicted 3-demethylubiquinone-9 3-methyltransferase (glyoxalase superfamily)